MRGDRTTRAALSVQALGSRGGERRIVDRASRHEAANDFPREGQTCRSAGDDGIRLDIGLAGAPLPPLHAPLQHTKELRLGGREPSEMGKRRLVQGGAIRRFRRGCPQWFGHARNLPRRIGA